MKKVWTGEAVARELRAHTVPVTPLNFVRLRDAAEVLGISHRTLRDWLQRGYGPEAEPLGRRGRAIHCDEIAAYRNRLNAPDNE
jgi:helix-turn-helix protein